jgi:hypothetical protein
MERVSDHCSNIAATLIQTKNETFDMHSYLQSVKAADGNEDFNARVKEYSEKFALAHCLTRTIEKKRNIRLKIGVEVFMMTKRRFFYFANFAGGSFTRLLENMDGTTTCRLPGERLFPFDEHGTARLGV